MINSALRTHKNGRMRVHKTKAGTFLPMKADMPKGFVCPLANPTGRDINTFPCAGDVRASEQVGLTVQHNVVCTTVLRHASGREGGGRTDALWLCECECVPCEAA